MIHLQTGGVSIVIGKEKDQINRIISTLAVFLTPGRVNS